jgi:pimeloyl-ACP methyl ester carboxylesterase
MLDRARLPGVRLDFRIILLIFTILTFSGGAARAATSLEPVSTLQGPKKARGVVVYSHGRSLTGEDSESPPPAYLKNMAKAGWDVLRFNRPSSEDTLPASSSDLTHRADALKAQGYRRVILTGQSFGAFLSIMAAEQTDAVDGVIATAPAAYGNFTDSFDTWRMNATELYRHLANLHGTRILLAFFHGDEYDPGGRGERSIELLSNSDDFAVVIDQPHSLAGHLAAATPQFAKRYASCLEGFAEARLDERACEDGTIISPSGKAQAQSTPLAGAPLGEATAGH